MFIKKETGGTGLPGTGLPGINESERRLHQRRRLFKGGKVIFNNRACVINCVVRDLSPSGAKLTFPTPQALPSRFHLEINDLGKYECELVRSKGVEYGVRFIVAV
ncbi:MAG TPA: PilZ domain-containing protein [Dongiaceae bacterium]|nr:PilZ domain-containing protein [Dongiaceae bacterium]